MRGFVVGVLLTLLVIAGSVLRCRTSACIRSAPTTLRAPSSGRWRAARWTSTPTSTSRQATIPCELTAANLIEGAKEYEEHCAFCHGGAKAKISPMRDKFNPPAPQLINRIPHDDDAWLFWVTKHGVRMTGMPTWDGVMSDEEMWKIIAFIKHSDKLPPDVQPCGRSWRRRRARSTSTRRSSTNTENRRPDRRGIPSAASLTRLMSSDAECLSNSRAPRPGS